MVAREIGYVASGTLLVPDADTILLKVTRINGGRVDVPREYPARRRVDGQSPLSPDATRGCLRVLHSEPLVAWFR